MERTYREKELCELRLPLIDAARWYYDDREALGSGNGLHDGHHRR
jgi:hypothetical protein